MIAAMMRRDRRRLAQAMKHAFTVDSIPSSFKERLETLGLTGMDLERSTTVDPARRPYAVAVASITGVVVAVAVSAAVYLTRSSSHSAPGAQDSRPSVPVLAPSYPTGLTFCGSYEIVATTVTGTLPLATCAGWPGLKKLPVVTLGVGQSVTVTVDPHVSLDPVLSLSNTGVLLQDGTSFLALHAGTILMTISGAPCVPNSLDGPQPASCPLMKVVVAQ